VNERRCSRFCDGLSGGINVFDDVLREVGQTLKKGG